MILISASMRDRSIAPESAFDGPSRLGDNAPFLENRRRDDAEDQPPGPETQRACRDDGQDRGLRLRPPAGRDRGVAIAVGGRRSSSADSSSTGPGSSAPPGSSLSEALAILETPLASERPRRALRRPSRRPPSGAPRPRSSSSRRPPTARRRSGPRRAGDPRGGRRRQAGPVASTCSRRPPRQSRSESAAAAEIDAAKAARLPGQDDRGHRSPQARDRVADRPRRPRTRCSSRSPRSTSRAASPADARATYQRLITDYPNSPYRADARQKVPLS